jgi:hypothetical protein
MGELSAPLVIAYGTSLSVVIEPSRPLRLSTMSWGFPERPELIALATVADRLDFLRDHLKSMCGLWDKLPRLFLDAYFRDIADAIARDRPALEALAAKHGGLFRPVDWSFSALCPLPKARLPAAPETPVDFAFWTGEDLYAIEIKASASPSRAQRDSRTRLRDNGVLITEIAGAGLERAATDDMLARLPAAFSDFWKNVPLPSSPFRVGSLAEILPA